MNEFDQFVKHKLHVKHYVRYTDDFAIVASDCAYLESLIGPITRFLNDHLALTLHPNKTSLRELHQGIDFLGYVVFHNHRLVRTRTRRRMLVKLKKKILGCRTGSVSEDSLVASLKSYLGVLSHADAVRIAEEMKNLAWLATMPPSG